MKTTKLLTIIALLTLASCAENKTSQDDDKQYTPQYYSYNPEDTVDNRYYWHLLRIDSLIVDFHLKNPRLGDSLDGFWGENLQMDSVYANADGIWHEFIDICAKKDYKKALEYYNIHEHDLAVAIPLTTLKFLYDLYVIDGIVFDNMPKEEAVAKMIEVYEFDKVMTEAVISFSTTEDSIIEYVPEHYLNLISVLRYLYALNHDVEKAENTIELYKQALPLFCPYDLRNEYSLFNFKLETYYCINDKDGILNTLLDHRAYMVNWAAETDNDCDEELIELDEMIESYR